MTNHKRLLSVISLSAATVGLTGGIAVAHTAHHKLTLKVSKPTIKSGQDEVFKGKLASGKKGVEIDLALKSGSQWLDITETTTRRHGVYVIHRTAPAQTGSYKFRTHNLVKNFKVTATSPTVTVTVTS